MLDYYKMQSVHCYKLCKYDPNWILWTFLLLTRSVVIIQNWKHDLNLIFFLINFILINGGNYFCGLLNNIPLYFRN